MERLNPRRRWARVRHATVSRKLNLVFGLFFIISSTLRILHFGFFIALDPTNGIATEVVVLLPVGIFLLLLSLFDSAIIKYTQLGLLLFGAIYMVFTEPDPGNLAPYLFLTIAMVATHRMQPFGSRTLPFLGGVAILALAGTFYAGTVYGYRLDQRLNLVNFGLTFFAILYVLFEEEIEGLRRQRDRLSRRTEELRPFAELGSNVAGLVHDLRGDIAGVYAIAEIERLSDNSDLADKLQSYGNRLNRRVDAIMYVAAARDRMDAEDVDLYTLLDSAIYYFAGIHREIKHQVAFTLDGEKGVRIRARRATILVIIENVVRNSIEATEGQVERRISIRFEQVDDHVTIRIENTGRPLPFGDGTLIQVGKGGYFRRGFTDKESGAGIGMQNVIRALTRLGAEMTMQDIPGGGIVSAISIPVTTREWLEKERNPEAE